MVPITGTKRAPEERGGVPAREALPGEMSAREELPWGRPVQKKFPRGNGGMCSHGKSSPGGTIEATRAEKVPLGELVGVPAREKLADFSDV